MASKGKHLVILCSNFPYGFGEPFLEVELEYLKRQFDGITICTTDRSERSKAPHFQVLEGVEIENFSVKISLSEKLMNLWRLIFDADLIEEKSIIKNAYHSHVSWGKLKTMLISKLRALSFMKQLEKFLDKQSERELYLYSYWADDAALVLSYFKRENPGTIAFCRVHGWDLYFERSSYFYLPFRKLIFNGLDAVFPISENGKNYLLSHFDTIINRGRVYQSRLGIKTVESLPDPNQKFRRFRLISCSNLIPIKRVELIVNALSHVDDLEVDWTHFGDGSESVAIAEKAEKLLGPKENIEYHFPGRIPNWQVLEYYSDHTVDLFITLSRYDGIPVSIMEAMSFGIPALATDVGGVSEIVINGKTGFLLDQEVEPTDVAEVIQKVASMPEEEYNSMRQEAKNIWGTFYSADINYPAFCEKVLSLGKS